MGTAMGTETTVEELTAWLRAAPAGTMVPASSLVDLLENVETPRDESVEPTAPDPSTSWTWREKLWDVPAETRLGVAEVAEALGRPRSYVYARTGPAASDPLPHRKIDGSVVIAAGELRTWIRDHEEVIYGCAMESPRHERGLHAV
jgi:hypothetical protein